MRNSILGLAFVIPALFAASTANAATRWTCEGPEFVCGSSASSAATTTRSYDASEDRPSRGRKARAESYDVASSVDEERPARTRKKRSYSSDEYEVSGDSYSGKASYYWQPQALASGGRFDPDAMTAAHKTLPFGTKVRVTNRLNGQSVVVTINDRGPYVAGRIIDLSRAAAHAINMQGAGVAPVDVAVLGRN